MAAANGGQVQWASSQEVVDATTVRNYLCLHREARQLADEQRYMLHQKPMTLLLERLPKHTLSEATRSLQEQTIAGVEGSYRRLIKTAEFKEFVKEMRYGHGVQKKIALDFEVMAKEKMRECRLCLIRQSSDFLAVEDNGMQCRLVIHSSDTHLKAEARNKKRPYILY